MRAARFLPLAGAVNTSGSHHACGDGSPNRGSLLGPPCGAKNIDMDRAGATIGARVVAPVSGIVDSAMNAHDGWGESVVIRSSDGHRHRVAHMCGLSVVRGQAVTGGVTKVGGLGNTGHVIPAPARPCVDPQGAHVHHHEVDPSGAKIDARPYLPGGLALPGGSAIAGVVEDVSTAVQTAVTRSPRRFLLAGVVVVLLGAALLLLFLGV